MRCLVNATEFSELMKSTHAPWVLGFCGDFCVLNDYLESFQASEPGAVVIILEGSRMTTDTAFYDEISDKLSFPDYFGRNLNALNECLTDLSWLDFNALVLVVQNADQALDIGILLEYFGIAGAEWAQPVCLGERWDRPGIPFHAIVAYEQDKCKVISDLPTITL